MFCDDRRHRPWTLGQDLFLQVGTPEGVAWRPCTFAGRSDDGHIIVFFPDTQQYWPCGVGSKVVDTLCGDMKLVSSTTN